MTRLSKLFMGTFQRHLTAGSVRKWPSQIVKGLWIKTCCFSGKERKIVSQYWSESLWLSDRASELGEGLRFYSSWGLLCPTLVTRRKKTSFSNIATFFLFLFNYAIQRKSITWLVNSELNCTWKPIWHSSLRDSCDIGFRVQFNTEFPFQ